MLTIISGKGSGSTTETSSLTETPVTQQSVDREKKEDDCKINILINKYVNFIHEFEIESIKSFRFIIQR